MLPATALRTRARMGAFVIRDYLLRPIAHAPTDVPWCAECVSREWLEAILCARIPGAGIDDFMVLGGHQGSSVRRQIRIIYNRAGRAAGLPEHLYTKCTPSLLTRLSSGMAAEAEGTFYRQLRPEIPIEAPTLYHSAYDRISGRSIHLFEDLVATKGARFCDGETRLSRSQIEEVVDTLGTVHGQFYSSDRFGSDLSWLPTYESFFVAGERNGNREGHDQAMLQAQAVIPGDVYRRREEIWPKAVSGLALHRSQPRTLLHSDVHVGNWYVTADGHLGLCDWACTCSGHWARDLAYALSTCLVPEDRRDWEGPLVVRYLEKLHQAGGPATDLALAWEWYRQQLFAALLMWTPTLCHPPTMPDMQPPEMSLEMIRRITTAIADLGALDRD